MAVALVRSLLDLATIASHPLSLIPLFVLRDRWEADFRVGQLMLGARHSDLTAVSEIGLKGEYGFIRGLNFPKQALVLDLGANVGCFAALVFSVRDDVEVHSVEPSPDTSALLALNSARYPKLRWDVHRIAIAAQSGTLAFCNEGPSTARRISGNQGVAVQAESFDAFVRRVAGNRRIFLCKMDIEGAEVPIFGAGPNVLGQIDHFVIEVHGAAENGELVRATLAENFPHVQAASGRLSSKPVFHAWRS